MEYSKPFRRFPAVFLSAVVWIAVLSGCTKIGILTTEEPDLRTLVMETSTQTPATLKLPTASPTLAPASPTPTRRPTRTAAPPKTQTPTKTRVFPTPEPTSTPAYWEFVNHTRVPGEFVYLGSPVVAYTMPGGPVYLQDVGTGNYRIILDNLYVEGEFENLGWRQQGCSFLAYMPDERSDIWDIVDIVEVDLQGNVLRTVFSGSDLKFDGEEEIWIFVFPSPSDEWIAFLTYSGEYTYRYDYYEGYHNEVENIYVTTVDGAGPHTQISENGGAWYFAWAPDSSKIAYSDFDDQGYKQVFVASPDGKERVQVTHFEEPDRLRWAEFYWSENGEYIFARVSPSPDSPQEDIQVISVNQQQATLFLEDVGPAWWYNDGTLAVWKEGQVTWYDPAHGTSIRKHAGPPCKPRVVQPGAAHLLWFIRDCTRGDYAVMVYNLETGQVVVYPDPFMGQDMVEEIYVTPLEFPGERNCK